MTAATLSSIASSAHSSRKVLPPLTLNRSSHAAAIAANEGYAALTPEAMADRYLKASAALRAAAPEAALSVVTDSDAVSNSAGSSAAASRAALSDSYSDSAHYSWVQSCDCARWSSLILGSGIALEPMLRLMPGRMLSDMRLSLTALALAASGSDSLPLSALAFKMRSRCAFMLRRLELGQVSCRLLDLPFIADHSDDCAARSEGAGRDDGADSAGSAAAGNAAGAHGGLRQLCAELARMLINAPDTSAPDDSDMLFEGEFGPEQTSRLRRLLTSSGLQMNSHARLSGDLEQLCAVRSFIYSLTGMRADSHAVTALMGLDSDTHGEGRGALGKIRRAMVMTVAARMKWFKNSCRSNKGLAALKIIEQELLPGQINARARMAAVRAAGSTRDLMELDLPDTLLAFLECPVRCGPLPVLTPGRSPASARAAAAVAAAGTADGPGAPQVNAVLTGWSSEVPGIRRMQALLEMIPRSSMLARTFFEPADHGCVRLKDDMALELAGMNPDCLRELIIDSIIAGCDRCLQQLHQAADQLGWRGFEDLMSMGSIDAAELDDDIRVNMQRARVLAFSGCAACCDHEYALRHNIDNGMGSLQHANQASRQQQDYEKRRLRLMNIMFKALAERFEARCRTRAAGHEDEQDRIRYASALNRRALQSLRNTPAQSTVGRYYSLILLCHYLQQLSQINGEVITASAAMDASEHDHDQTSHYAQSAQDSSACSCPAQAHSATSAAVTASVAGGARTIACRARTKAGDARSGKGGGQRKGRAGADAAALKLPRCRSISSLLETGCAGGRSRSAHERHLSTAFVQARHESSRTQSVYGCVPYGSCAQSRAVVPAGADCAAASAPAGLTHQSVRPSLPECFNSYL